MTLHNLVLYSFAAVGVLTCLVCLIVRIATSAPPPGEDE